MNRPKHENESMMWVEVPREITVHLFEGSGLRKHAPDVDCMATVGIDEVTAERVVLACVADARARWQDKASAIKCADENDAAECAVTLRERVDAAIERMNGTLHGTVGRKTSDPVLRQLRALCVNLLPKGRKMATLDSIGAVGKLFVERFGEDGARERFPQALAAAKNAAKAVAPAIKL